MRRIFIPLIMVLVISSAVLSQDVKSESNKQFMHITTIESVIAGGLGRSKMIITSTEGSQKEPDMENLFSQIDINFRNVRQNEERIIRALKSFTDDGWKPGQTVTLTLSQNDSGSGGMFMTGYLLS